MFMFFEKWIFENPHRDRYTLSMASKGKVAGKLGKNVKKVAKKQEYAPFLKVVIPTGSAIAAPPLGPQLAQVVCFQLYDL